MSYHITRLTAPWSRARSDASSGIRLAKIPFSVYDIYIFTYKIQPALRGGK